MLLVVWTNLVGNIMGTVWMRKCTWSWSDPISTKWISYLSEIPKHISFNVLSTSFENTFRLYFTGHTRWKSSSVLLWRLRICSLTRTSYYERPPRSKLRGNLFHYNILRHNKDILRRKGRRNRGQKAFFLSNFICNLNIHKLSLYLKTNIYYNTT